MKTKVLKTKRNYKALIFTAIILLILIPLTLILFIPKNKQNHHTEISITPTPLITIQPTSLPISQPSQPKDTSAPQQRLLEKVNNRQSLSTSDMTVKNKIISSLPSGETSGIVYQTPDVTIQYIQSLNIFQAEITTTNVSSAKEEATSWFLNQGMSKQGLCNLPLSFYLNFSVKNQLLR